MTEHEKTQKHAPKVFVSYAHENPDHKNWVKSLATGLRAGGIDALLDEWKVAPGEDFTLFMDEIRTCD
ncbi:MAG: toll/interleukin-1 receptor domain-containing protein [Phycisphaerae bacterium]|nr:toll/interleukin-1 receptor domain-containing protein [Phycisphaerae bacterium]